MKAILVIDIDDEKGKRFYSCDFIVTDRYGSNIIYPTISFSPMPEKDRPRLTADDFEKGWCRGWNECINEILGEEE